MNAYTFIQDLPPTCCPDPILIYDRFEIARQCVWRFAAAKAAGMIKIGVDRFWNRAHKCKRKMLITRLGVRDSWHSDAKC